MAFLRYTCGVSMIKDHPMYQNDGIASRLKKYVDVRTREYRGRMISVSASSIPEYMPARRLYQKNGYMEMARVNNYFMDDDFKLIYAKRLAKTSTY